MKTNQTNFEYTGENLGNLANNIAALVANGFDDSTLLNIGEMMLNFVAKDSSDAAYTKIPTITQFVTEEMFRRGISYKLPGE